MVFIRSILCVHLALSPEATNKLYKKELQKTGPEEGSAPAAFIFEKIETRLKMIISLLLMQLCCNLLEVSHYKLL
jgi:hypothetical protein